MSDPVVPVAASVSVEAASTGVVEAAPAPVPAPAPAPASVDFSDLTAVLKLALVKLVEVELQGEAALDEKIKKVAELLKADIRAADLPLSIRMAAMDWVNDSLPHVIRAVDLVKAEVKKAAASEVQKIEKAAVVEIKKCCPSFFTKKV
jgi:hypothetical protein